MEAESDLFGKTTGSIDLISSPKRSLSNNDSLDIILDTLPLNVFISPL